MITEKTMVEDLDFGMYVSQLDRPWLDSPFLIQGFVIKDEDELAQLREHCEYVYVDLEQSSTLPSQASPVSPSRARPSGDASPEVPDPSSKRDDRVSVEKEIEFARSARASLKEAVGSLMDAVRDGKKPNVEQLRDSVAEMESSIIRNPDAFMLLRSLQERDSYTFSHCIDSSVMAIAFARHLGLPKDQVSDLGLGALLADIGKVRISPSVLTAARRLSGAELEEARTHVTHSVDIMKELPGMSPRVLSIASTHHERFDGSGYPQGLSGDQIPLMGCIAGLVDWFDALTSDRPYGDAESLQTVVQMLYQCRDASFPGELVERFIQMLGVYPIGTLVELSTGEVGIVIGQNRHRRLRPKVMLVLDSEKRPLHVNPVRDLLSETTAEDGSELTVLTTLSPGSYGISPQDYFL
jgi:HD-GYP domain-containing protein (c-di-GMP phosphodiesterase class II)